MAVWHFADIFDLFCIQMVTYTAISHNNWGLFRTLISIMIVFFLAQKKHYIDTERWEQRPKRCTLALEIELEFFFIEKKKTVIMEIRVVLPLS
jgi:hypothetical protein